LLELMKQRMGRYVQYRYFLSELSVPLAGGTQLICSHALGEDCGQKMSEERRYVQSENETVQTY
jgi:hypothetical protein